MKQNKSQHWLVFQKSEAFKCFSSAIEETIGLFFVFLNKHFMCPWLVMVAFKQAYVLHFCMNIIFIWEYIQLFSKELFINARVVMLCINGGKPLLSKSLKWTYFDCTGLIIHFCIRVYCSIMPNFLQQGKETLYALLFLSTFILLSKNIYKRCSVC